METSIVGLAHQKSKLSTNVIDIRKFSQDKHKKVDDYPYGGGGGMVMSPQPLADALKDCDCQQADEVIYFTPQGKPLLQADLHELEEKAESCFGLRSLQGHRPEDTPTSISPRNFPLGIMFFLVASCQQWY